MGAIGFTNMVEARTAQEGYNRLVKQAQYEYGHDHYNGTISTCELTRCRGKFDIATQENIDKAYEMVEKDDYGQKWEAWYIDLGPKKKGLKKHVFLFYGLAAC